MPGVTVEYIDIEEDPLEFMENNWPEKFDIIVANPPYSKKLDLKFLDKCYDLVNDEIVFVHPATLFIERSGNLKIYEHILEKIKSTIKSITIFNGNAAFNIGIFSPCSITHLSKINKGDKFFLKDIMNHNEVYLDKNKIKDISYFGYNENFISLDKKIKPVNNLGTKRIGNPSKYTFNIQFSNISGHIRVGERTSWLDMDSPLTQPDFFALVRRSTFINESSEIQQEHIWGFATKEEAENFIIYCKTDFARTCLALTKINRNTNFKCLSRIPWMDFTQKWTDKKLYKHFNITKEEQVFIKEIIPPYYD